MDDDDELVALGLRGQDRAFVEALCELAWASGYETWSLATYSEDGGQELLEFSVRVRGEEAN